MMRHLFLLLICNCFVQLNAQYQIGHTTITYIDASRSNRAIATEIYYPALTAGNNTTAASGQFPVIVFGHGFVMAWSAYQNIWEHYTPLGYILVFPKTESALTVDHQNFGWDLQYLVTKIQDEGQLGSSVLFNAVAPETALMGHSMGGGAAFLAADSLSSNGNTNFKTLIGLAPAESSTNGVSSIASAASVTKPSLIFSGSGDGVTPPIDHHIPMYNGLASSCKAFVNILGGGHCYFAQTDFFCDFGETATISGVTITRSQQQQTTYALLDNWLDYYLRDNCAAKDQFMTDIQSMSGIIGQTTCTENVLPVITENTGNLISSVSGISYQWYYEGNVISNSNSISILPTLTGNYTVEVTYADGCIRLSTIYVYTIVGLEEFTANYSISPNPTNGIVSIKSNKSGMVHVEIFDVFGKVISTTDTSDKIDMSNLNNGIYLLSIEGIKYRIVKN